MLKATVNSRSFKLQLRGLVANAKRADLGRWSGLLANAKRDDLGRWSGLLANAKRDLGRLRGLVANARRDFKERSFRSMLKLGDGKSALSASGVERRDFVS